MYNKVYPLLVGASLMLGSLSLQAQDRERIDRYVDNGETWLSDRLQMHWRTHATQQFMNGEVYDHCGGDSAAVPTLQINGARSHVTPYKRPTLEQLEPRQEDPRGMYLQNSKLPGEPYEWVALSQTGNIIGSINLEICGLALDAANRWQQTGELKYASAAWHVLDTYMQGVLHTEMPIDMNHGHMQTLYGLQTHEVIHEDALPRLCLIYKVLRDGGYLKQVAGQQDLEQIYEAAFKHWADIIEQNGVPHNNWDLMQARYIFNVGQILKPNSAYPDGKGQEHYFAIVETGKSIRQWSLKALTEFGYDPDNGIWCECPGYSQVVLGDLAEFVRLYREQLGRDLTQQLPIIVKAARNNVEYLFPDSMTIGFGDTHPSRLKQEIYDKLGIDFATLHPSRTFAAPRTSWLIQRNGMDRLGSLAFALNGSDGNHMHANGPSLELYGRGLRLAPDAGIGYALYSGDDYHEWYSQFPSHNTVCVDGISTYAVMKSNHPFEILQNDELQVAGTDITAQVSEVYMFEPETRSDQQRLVLLVTTGPTTGYFVDVFRSRRQDGQDKTHDYFYHNMGQSMHTMDASTDQLLPMQPTQELAFAGAHLYAYSYMYDKMRSQTAANLKVTYTVHPDEQYMTPRARQLWADGDVTMTQWTRGEQERAIIQCLSPTTEGLSRVADMPYNIREQATLTFVARQYGEAWQRPFVSVFEPSSTAKPGTVRSVGYPEVKVLDKSTESAVAILVEHHDGTRQLIVSTDNDQARVKVLGKVYNGRVNVASL